LPCTAVSRASQALDAAAEQVFELVRDAGAALVPEHRLADLRGGVCDGNNIAACGVPVVDTMGVRGGAIHSSGRPDRTFAGQRAAALAVNVPPPPCRTGA
jgi:hypothetical protein